MIRTPLYCPYCAEPFVKRHHDGRERLYCPRCNEVYYENPLPAVTALVLKENDELLLGKRSVEPARGAWCLPGGFMELGETMEEAALRELQEETGLEGSVAGFVGCLSHESRYYGKTIIIFGYRVQVTGGEMKAQDDMDELMFFSIDSLPALAFTSHQYLVDCLLAQEAKRG